LSEAVRALVTVAVLLVMTLGLIGTVVPVLPGSILILLAALVYAILDGFRVIGWPTLIILGVLTLLSTLAEVWVSSAGARAGGASGWSVAAGLVGGFVGLLVLSLPGAIVGAILFVLAAELIRLKDWRQALKAGGGWMVGWLLSTVVSAGLALTMIAIFVWQLLRGA
jgi:uncharacterized protein YqgC (DUF456 family)